MTAREVRLNRAPFSGQWEAVQLAKDGRTVTSRWPLHPDDAKMLDELLAVDAALSPAAAPRTPEQAPEAESPAGDAETATGAES